MLSFMDRLLMTYFDYSPDTEIHGFEVGSMCEWRFGPCSLLPTQSSFHMPRWSIGCPPIRHSRVWVWTEWVGGGTHRLSNLEGSHELNPAAWLMGSRRCPLRDAHWMLVLLPPAPWGGRYTFCPSRTMHSLLPQPQYTCSTVILVG